MHPDDDVAIIGMAGVFPQEAHSVDALWRVACDGRRTLCEVPAGRYNVDTFYDPDPARNDTVKMRHGGFIADDPFLFDAGLFGISPAEAASMDPQQRKLLEVSYHALEDACLPQNTIAGSKTAVYTAIPASIDWDSICKRDLEVVPKYYSMSNANAMLSNRISHAFDFRGPSATVDTACSSALTAVDLACQAIKRGAADMSVVAGCNLILTPETVSMRGSNAGVLSPDGVSHSFDSRASGYGRSEGFAAVVLKPVRSAIRDGNIIRAVIRATATNVDGKTPSFHAPSGASQAQLIEHTYRLSGLDASQTAYVEAHGTGTSIGDPIEANAIGEAFQRLRSGAKVAEPLIVGSIKSNIGHMENASGLAALIKTVRMLETALIPPVADLQILNPEIKAADYGLEFPRTLRKWPDVANGLRRASINNFGLGGANAHCVLDDAASYLRAQNLNGNHSTLGNPRTPQQTANGESVVAPLLPKLVVLSAADEAGIGRQARQLGQYLQQDEVSPNLGNVCDGLTRSRTNLGWRSFALLESLAPLVENTNGVFSKPCRAARSPELGFVFTGQGAVRPHMGRDLMCFEPYKESILAAGKTLRPLGFHPPPLEIFENMTQAQLNEPLYSQTICTVLQVALVDLLRSVGAAPQHVVGHSSGEIAAAYAAGALSREAAWKIAYFRGKSLQTAATSSSGGQGMMVVQLSRSSAQQHIDQQGLRRSLWVACANSDTSSTISGLDEPLGTLQTALKDQGILAKRLDVTRAYHSPLMHAVGEEYQKLLAAEGGLFDFSPTDGPTTIYSSVTGLPVPLATYAKSAYWVQNLVSPVDFVGAIKALQRLRKEAHADGQLCFVEVGPHASLRRPVLDGMSSSRLPPKYSSCLQRDAGDRASLLTMAGELFTQGIVLDLGYLNGSSKTHGLSRPELPKYAFNHSIRHADSSRLDNVFRLGNRKKTALLGTPEIDWNKAQPSWRFIIRKSENAWVLDHKVNNRAIFPAAGYCVMAIEAAKHLASASAQFKGVSIKNLSCDRPLPVHDAAHGAEMRISLCTRNDHPSKSFPAHDFTVYGEEDGEWYKMASGTVQLQGHRADELKKQVTGAKPNGIHTSPQESTPATSVESQEYYDFLSGHGIQYGPCFQLLDRIHSEDSDGRPNAVALLKTGMLEQSRSYDKAASGFLIHPTILDAALQMPMAVLTKGGRSPMPTTVVSSVEEIHISAELAHLEDTSQLDLSCHQVQDGFRQKLYNAAISRADGSQRLVSVAHLTMTDISSSSLPESSNTVSMPPIYTLDWQPPVDELTSNEAREFFKSRWPGLPSSARHVICSAEALSTYFARRAVVHLDGKKNTTDMPSHRSRWIKSLRNFAQRPQQPDVQVPSAEEVQALTTDAEKLNPVVQMTLRFGNQIEQVLDGQVDPLHILFSDSLIQRFYAVGLASETAKVADYVALLAQNKPGLRVLEIGAGTGSATNEVIKASFRVATKPFAQYTYTDVSSAFFAKAGERFGSQVPEMEFRRLDISRDLLEQGFAADNYDVVIAGSVMHVASDLTRAVSDVTKLLRPGGKLILVEPTNTDLAKDTFLFGSIPSWWTGSEVVRANTPLLSEPRWDLLLRDCGLSGVDVASRDFSDWNLYGASTIISTRTAAPTPTKVETPICILVEKDQEQERALAELLQREFLHTGAPVTINTTSDDCEFTGKIAIVLFDISGDFLGHLDATKLAFLQKLCTDAKNILWLSQNSGDAFSSPEKAKVEGLSRVICTERDEEAFTVARFENTVTSDGIVARCRRIVEQMIESTAAEPQYNEHNGLLTCGRLIPSSRISEVLHNRAQTSKPQAHRLAEHPKEAISLTTQAAGSLSAFRFIENQTFKTPPTGDEVDIEVKYAGLNFHDVVVALGQLPDTVLGLDGAGIVRHVGPEAQFKIGDLVAFYTTNCMSTYVRCTSLDAHAIPAGTSLASAGALPGVACTAHVAIHRVARLQRGERILIHAAAGGLGQMAIQLAQLVGADIFATVSSSEKRQVLIDQYSVPSDRIFYSRDASFAEDIRRITANQGVDVVVNSLSGQLLQESFALLRHFGRFVEVGKKDIDSNASLQMRAFGRGAMFAAVDLSMPEAAPMRREAWHEFVKLMQSHPGLHEPRPLHIVSASQVETAFRMLQSGTTAGKVLVELGASDEVQLLRTNSMRLQLDPNASYFVAGGYGGLGQCIVQWLISAGAHHVIILTRRKLEGDAAAEAFVQEAQRKHGATIQLSCCDVADVESLQKIVNEAQAKHPIKGCIQCAMMLDDQSFSKMTLDQYKGPLAPKEIGTRNLHTLLPKGMDFFVMLSSLSGQYGIHGQSAYAAGNTYQDALARYRRSIGERAISIDLGAVADAGYMLYGKTIGVFDRAVTESIYVQDLLRVLDLVCDPELCNSLSPPETHIVLGVTHPLRFKQADKTMPRWLSRPAFRHLHGVGEGKVDGASDKAQGAGAAQNTAVLVQAAETEDAADSILVDALQDRLCKIMALSKNDVDMSQPFHSVGVDSLVAIELRHWFMSELHQEVKTNEFLTTNGMNTLCQKTVRLMRAGGDAQART